VSLSIVRYDPLTATAGTTYHSLGRHSQRSSEKPVCLGDRWKRRLALRADESLPFRTQRHIAKGQLEIRFGTEGKAADL
jgi:hypothetical protein